MSAEFERSVGVLLEGYDKLLSEVIPSPSFLPVTVTLSIPSRGFRVPKVQLKPVDHMDDIKRRLADALEKSGNPVVSWGDDVRFMITRPLEIPGAPSASGSPAPAAAGSAAAAMVVMEDATKAVHQMGILAGSEVALVGTVQLKSDMPKECFSAVFSKDKPEQLVDYFTCRDCRTNCEKKVSSKFCHSNSTWRSNQGSASRALNSVTKDIRSCHTSRITGRRGLAVIA